MNQEELQVLFVLIGKRDYRALVEITDTMDETKWAKLCGRLSIQTTYSLEVALTSTNRARRHEAELALAEALT